MPTYDYQCSSCGHEYELFQSITAKPKKKCPECGRQTANRLIGTGGAIIFKGSGFYETDYRSNSYKEAAKAEKEASSGDSKKDKSAGDSKAASKSDNGSSSAGKSKPAKSE